MARLRIWSIGFSTLLLLIISIGGSVLSPSSALARNPLGGETALPTVSINASATATTSDDPTQVALVDISADAPTDALAGISVGTGGSGADQSCFYTVGEDSPSNIQGVVFETNNLSFQVNQASICSKQDLKDSQAYAIAPNGTRFNLTPFSYVDSGDDTRIFVVTLPLSAYMQPGLWKFGIKKPEAIELPLKIILPNEPFVMRGRGDSSLVGGFRPNEAVKAIAYRFQPNNGNGRWIYVGVATFQVSKNGSRVFTVRNSSQLTLVLLGQQRSFAVGNARFEDNGKADPPSSAQLNALMKAYWSGAGNAGNTGNTGGNTGNTGNAGNVPVMTPPGGIKTRTDGQSIPQVWVPAGCFSMGSASARDMSEQIKDHTQRQVCLTEGYWIDKFEVSNQAYEQFIAAGGYTNQAFWSPQGWQWRQSQNRQRPNNFSGLTDPNQPRVGITRFEAEAYARWRGGSLPTEAEWEYAARSPQALRYPWGNTFQNGRANIKDVAGKTVNVASFPEGQSWVGALNMAGNVGEWVADCFDQAYDRQNVKDNPSSPCNGSNEMVKGSSWAFNQIPAQGNYRFVNPSQKAFFDVGVRIVSK